MKKFITAILAILYLGTSIGAPLHLHYCMGKLVSWGLIDHEAKNCGNCGMLRKMNAKQCATKMNCCKDDHKLIKSDKDQKVSSSAYELLKIHPDALVLNYGSLADTAVNSFSTEHPNANAPPQRGKVPLFLLNRNFRI
ncbi:HYC_CC_PP family protein [Flavitalea flava]